MQDIFNSISKQLDIPEIANWIADLNQLAMFGIFRRNYLSKARNLLTMLTVSLTSSRFWRIVFSSPAHGSNPPVVGSGRLVRSRTSSEVVK